MKKKMISLLLVLALAVGINPSAYAIGKIGEVTANAELDSLDVAISASYVLNSSDATANFVNKSTAMQTLPLYNADGSIAAYYTTFAGGGYAVINNNVDNPVAIEFGEGRQPMIEEILAKNNNPHIIYCSPVEVYDTTFEVQESRAVQSNSLYENLPGLLHKNEELSSVLLEQRKLVEDKIVSTVSPCGDGDYGFIEWSDMPSGAYTADDIPFYGTEWVWMNKEFSKIDENCCGAVASMNLALYFANAGHPALRKSTDLETFKAVFSYIGKGPAVTIADGTKKYFASCGYELNYSTNINNVYDLKQAISNDRPCGMLLMDGLLSWHWVIGVGYRSYNITGNIYTRVVNGWETDANRFYLWDNGSTYMSGSQYWMD